ncbi:MAG: TonB-dependent receptor domain-containing protein [Bacteroidota bacterium]
MRILSFVSILIFTSVSAFGQSSSLHGTIVDQESGEEIIGANVLIVGTTTGASTDLDGKYAIRNILPGTYDVRVTYVGFASKVVTGVTLKPDESLQLDISIASEAYSSEEVVISAERVLSTESAILAERKKAASIGDGISAEQVKRSPDATSGDALKRVTGLTVVDNKFVYIRGVTDRYNGATLNGVSVTSTDTDVDKKSFSFDMVPANLLENMVVTKTATPDLPGDFTGGLVQINTLEFPNRQTIRLTLSSSFNSLSNLTNVQMSPGGSRDWLGFDDGSRSQPSDALDRYSLGQSLTNTWAQRTRRAPLNGAINLSIGDRIDVGEQDLLGYIAAVSYRNGFQRTETRLDYETSGGVPVFQDGKRDQYSVLWGTIFDVNYKFSGMHKISFQNSFNQTGEDKVSRLNGVDENEQNLKTEVVEWDQRSSYVGKISGEHNLPEFGGLEVRWRGSYNMSTAKEPDRRTSIYARNIYYSDPEPFSTSSPQRSWSTLNEYTRSAGLDFSLPVGDAQFKFGGLYESRDRDFDIRFYVTELENSSNVEMWNQGIDSIYRPENYGPGKFYMQRLDNNRDPYTGELDVIASYAMIDLPFTLLSQELRLVGGARVENADQRVHTVDPDIAQPTPFTVLLKNVDILPSVNLTYLVNDFTNLRFAYSNSVNRPEFREMSDFYYFDYNTFEGMHGNTNLKRAFIRNYDARLELFPDIGEVVAVSYFYKNITDAIEQSLVISSNPERSWFNSPKGRNCGWEFEVRKSFGFMRDIGASGIMQDALDYLSNISVTGNYTRIHSEIDFVDERTLLPGKREMQGQSPWMVNLSLSFVEPNIGTGVNVLHSEFGRRLDAVGDYTYLDVFEDPRSVIDLSVTQPILKGVEMKFAVKDLTAQDKTFTYRPGEKYKKISTGRTYSLQASFTL